VKGSGVCKRYCEIVAAYTGNDPEVEAGLKALYKDQANWPADLRERMKEYGA